MRSEEAYEMRWRDLRVIENVDSRVTPRPESTGVILNFAGMSNVGCKKAE